MRASTSEVYGKSLDCRSQTESSSPIVFVPDDEAYEAGFEDMPRRVPALTKVHQLVG